MPNICLEAPVVAILAKSVAGAPQTPFMDVFRVSNLDNYDNSDDDSTSESGSNLSSIGEVTGGKGAWKPVITCWVHLELMCIFPTM